MLAMPSSAPPAESALNLRLVLAGFGLVACTALAVLAFGADFTLLGVVLVVLVVVAAVDLVVIVRRRAERGRAEAAAGRRVDHGLFE